MLDMYRGDEIVVGRLCKRVMENIKEYAKIYMPDIDFSWLICPLKADMDIGTHYGTMQELEV